MGLEKLKRTPPGLETQVTAQTILFGQKGEPLITVVDGQPTVGETEAYLAISHLLLPEEPRVWRKIRRKRKPTIIGL